MSTLWNEIREEFQESRHKKIRQKYIHQYFKETGRNFVLYATDFISGSKPGLLTMLNDADKQLFSDTVRELDPQKNLDVMIESPGGIGTVAEAIADMLRSRFNSVRFIVPNMAKSAATILCLSGDEILMNEQSEIGPIDPQMQVRQPNGDVTYSPAHIIIEQFKTMLATIANNQVVGRALAPYLQMYFPSFLQECQNAIGLSKTIAIKLLTNYMFKNNPEAVIIAGNAADKLAEFQNHLSHSRALGIQYATDELKLKIYDLRTQPKLDKIVRKIYLSVKETFNQNPRFVKICENSQGHGSILQINLP